MCVILCKNQESWYTETGAFHQWEVEVIALSPDEATELVLRLILDMGIWIPLLIMCPLAAFLIGLSFLFDGNRRREQRRVGTQALVIAVLAAAGLLIFWIVVQYISF